MEAEAVYLLDQSVNITTAPDAWRDKCKPVFRDGKIADWIIPKGTKITGDEAILRVSTGQCAPANEACAKACGQSTSQLRFSQRLCLSAEAGIKGKNDFDLFMADVIDGYGPGTTDEKPVYKPGKNWDAYNAALNEQKKKEATDE